MFTGIIETVGTIETIETFGEGRRLTLSAPWAEDLSPGESVAVDGCCLTAVRADAGRFDVEAVRETVRRTIVADYEPGRGVHLERALAVGTRLGGHFVQGHVDDVGRVESIERRRENRYIELSIPAAGRPLVADRGSIAVNGVSLTILAVTETGVRLSIVPYTWRATTLSELTPGARANVEYDVIARYVQRAMEVRS